LKNIKVWIAAARLRTLPLSVSGIVVGTAMANAKGFYDPWLFLLSVLTAIAYQVTSNFANDYGDGVKGTDGEDRIGPERALQSGALTATSLKKGILIGVVVSIVLSVGLIYLAFDLNNWGYPLLFISLGGASIWAALKYTMGDSPYGYKGLGDVFVFIFFGLIAVLGSLFLYTKNLQAIDWLPAIAMGLFCTGVLNLNNLRDRRSDALHGKNTLIVKMGFDNGKKYHATLILVGIFCFTFHVFSMLPWEIAALSILPFGPMIYHLEQVVATKESGKLDPQLKKLALTTFSLSLLFYVLINNFL